jgi:MYXO-CTERM domain-containing protein
MVRLVCLAACAAVALGSGVVHACSWAPYLTADASLDPDDHTPPGAASATVVEIERGREGDGADCADLGHVRLRLSATDDRTLPGQLRFKLELIEGTPPFTFPDEPISLAQNGDTWLTWGDYGGVAFRIVVVVRAVDLGGNVGPPSAPVVIEDAGRGCQVGSGGDGSGWIAALLFVAAFGFRRLIPRDPR